MIKNKTCGTIDPKINEDTIGCVWTFSRENQILVEQIYTWEKTIWNEIYHMEEHISKCNSIIISEIHLFHQLTKPIITKKSKWDKGKWITEIVLCFLMIHMDIDCQF